MKIKFILLNVEAGEEVPVVFDEDQKTLFIASVLKSFTDNGYVISQVDYIDK